MSVTRGNLSVVPVVSRTARARTSYGPSPTFSMTASDKQTRSAYVDDLAEKAGIQYLVALSYSDDSVNAHWAPLA